MPELTEKQLQDAFERYYQHRLRQAGAHAPGLEQRLLTLLEQEAHAGKVPLPDGNTVLIQDPRLVEAIYNGQEVALGKERIRVPKASPSPLPFSLTLPQGLPQVTQLPAVAKVGLILVCFLLPLLVFGLFMLSTGDAEGARADAAQPTIEVQATALPGTPTPDLSLAHDRAPAGPHDPASVELAGFSYVLSLGRVQGGTWEPEGAEWLAGTEVRRVIALPWEADTAPVLTALPAGTPIQLRLRSGEVVRYELATVTRLARQQIEVLAEHTPSLVIVLHSEPASDERTVLVAQAVQGEILPALSVEAAPASSMEPIP